MGAAFVGTSGNTETSTFGADFLVNRRWPEWRLTGTAGAVRASDDGEPTAERYSATLRGDRVLTSFLSLTAGEKAERDELAGIALRNIADAGLSWALIRQPRWTLDGLTSMAWLYEDQIGGPMINSPAGVFQLLSKVPFTTGADTSQRYLLSELRGRGRLPVGGRDHRAGSDERPARTEVRVPMALFEPAGLRVREDRHHDDGVNRRRVALPDAGALGKGIG